LVVGLELEEELEREGTQRKSVAHFGIFGEGGISNL
jgi:hypothetical protein